MQMDGRVALVTGGAHRVGRALVLALARAGADIALHYHHSTEAAERTAGEVAALGRRVELFPADLADAGEAASLAGRVVDVLGRLDLLVNNAALFESAPFAEVSAGDWDRVMAVNTRAPFLLLQATAPHLAASNGLAVNIADVSGLRPWPAFPHHSVSKAALIHLTRVAARALAPDVRVACIVPGTVLPPEDYTEEQLEESAARTVLGRNGSPQDVVEALFFLVRSEFTTGSVLVVDGGRMLR
jgi:NAD(P)-dependent dehydrogenase (short-subunit alcohol dehydrogenase family)